MAAVEEVPAASTGLLPAIPGKRCAHCNTQTTPLWRNGPDGPKTLCNACGVRDNRRHAKNRNAAARPRPRKPQVRDKPKVQADGSPGVNGSRPKRSPSLPAHLASQDLQVGGRRSARWNAGLLTKRAKMESEAAAAAPKKARGSSTAAAAHGADVGPDGQIHVPTFVTIEDYDASSLTGFKLSAGYVTARPDTPAGRFGAGSPAPLYTATSEDNAWLSGVNAPRGGGSGAMAGESPFLKEQQLEQLFDVFEEASWHTGEMVPSAEAAYDILGYSTSVAEAEEAAATAALSMDINVIGGGGGQNGKAPALTAVTDTTEVDMFSCEDLSWAEGDLPLMSPMAMDDTAAGAWDAVDAYPVKAGASGAGANDREAMEEEDGHGSALSDSPPLTPNGSVEPGDKYSHGPPSDKDSLEEGEPSTPGGSGSGSDSAGDVTDLDESDDEGNDAEGKLGNGKSSDLATTMKTTGKTTRCGAKADAAAAAAKTSRQNCRGYPQAVNAGASELDKNVNKEHNNNNIMNNNNSNNSNVPSAADAALVYAYYRERRVKNNGVALLQRFESPAPPSVRAGAQLGADRHEDGEDGSGSGSSQAAVAAAHHADKYQFVLGMEAVHRQQRDRAARGEAIAAAARRRRRRACFNPAASKRRRKQQAEMEIAVAAPLTIVYEPFPEHMLMLIDEHAETEAKAETAIDAAIVEDVKVEAEEVKVEAEDVKVEAADVEVAAPEEEETWESDDDIPLATLAERESSPEPTLAAIALAAEAKAKAAKAEAKAAKGNGKGKQPPTLQVNIAAARVTPLAIESPIIPTPSPCAATAAKPSVMRKVASAASVVLSRAHSLLSMSNPALHEPPMTPGGGEVSAAAAAVAHDAGAATRAVTVAAPAAPTIVGGLPLPLNPTTPRRRRTPRFGGDRSASPRLPFLADGGAGGAGPAGHDVMVEG